MKRDNDENPLNESNGNQNSTGPAPKRVRNEGDQDIRLLIPSRFAGGVIGKGGENIKKLRSEHQAQVSVGDCQGPERVITIGASLETCCNVIRDLLTHFDKAVAAGENNELRILIHQSLAGCVIGKGGAKIKELKEKLGCRLKVFSNIAPQSTDRVIQIIGTDEKCIEAVDEIVNLIKDTPVKGNVRNYDPHNYDQEYADEYGGYAGDSFGGGGGGGNRNNGGNFGGRNNRFNDRGGPGGNMRGRDFGDPWASGPPMGGRNNAFGGGGGFGGGMGGNFGGQQGFGNNAFGGNNGGNFGGPQSDNNADKSSTQVTIPKDRAGAVIGKGGNRIRRIRMQSNAFIQIDEALPGSEDRIITITGTPQQIQAAQYMLQQSIREDMA